MNAAPFGVPLSFEVTLDPSLAGLVAMTVYDDSGASPALVAGPTAMALFQGGTFRAKFTASAGKPYLVVKSVYTDGTFTTLDTNWEAGSESFVAVLPPNPAAVTVKKNTAFANFEFPLQDTAGQPVTGATVTATRSIDGAAFGACANAAAEVGSGIYKINLAAADLNGDFVTFLFTAVGALPTRVGIATEL